MITKPMLAGTDKVLAKVIAAIKYPVLATPKLDGIRCLIVGGKALSRRFIDIPNYYVRQMMKDLPDGLDGELMVPGADFNQVQSPIMTENGNPPFEYHVFDYVMHAKPGIIQFDGLAVPYSGRIRNLEGRELPAFCKKVLPTLIENEAALLSYEEQVLSQGYEGVMLRQPDGPYKCGRSTLREGYLLKLKRFLDSEAVVLGFEEKMHNMNEKKRDELGHAKRSSHKENLVPAGTLGSLLVRDLKTGQEFGIGTGFNDATRLLIWTNRDNYKGQIVAYKYQPVGMKDKPRFPTFKQFRDERDMS